MKICIYRFLLITAGLIGVCNLYAQPTFEYVKAFRGTFPIEFRCVTATMDGGIAVATVDDDYSSFSDAGNITLWKFDGEGNLLWQKFNGVFEGSGSVPTRLIQLQDSGFLIGGYLQEKENFVPVLKAYLQRTDKDGNLAWQKEFDNSGRGFISDIKEDKNGNLIVSMSGKTSTNNQIAGSVLKYSPTGDSLWRWDMPSNYVRTRADLINVLDQGEIVVGGYAYGFGTQDWGYIGMLSPNGNLIWEAKQLPGSGINTMVYQNGELWATAKLLGYPSNEDFSKLFLGKLDPKGNLTHTDTITTLSGNQNIRMTNAPHGVLLGLTGGTPSTSGSDIYLFGLGQQGNQLWSFPVDPQDSVLYNPLYSYVFQDFSYSKDGELFVVGNGGEQNEHAFLIKYRRDTTTVSIESDISDQKQVSIFPNPTQDVVHIQPAHSLEYAIRLLDITGKLLLTRQGQHQETISLAAYPDGTYILQVTVKDGEWQHVKVVKE